MQVINEKNEFSGVTGDIWTALADYLNFTYEIYVT